MLERTFKSHLVQEEGSERILRMRHGMGDLLARLGSGVSGTSSTASAQGGTSCWNIMGISKDQKAQSWRGRSISQEIWKTGDASYSQRQSRKRKQEVCTVQMKEVAAALTFISAFQVCFSRRNWEISLSKCPDSKGVMGMETQNAGDQDTKTFKAEIIPRTWISLGRTGIISVCQQKPGIIHDGIQ